MLPYEDARSLSLLYHLNSEPWQTPDVPGDQLLDHGDRTDLARVDLPRPADTPLRALFARRASCRHFTARPLEAARLATLLANARAAPSAGGLCPLALYVATHAVVGVPDGVHYYDARAHALAFLRPPRLGGLAEWGAPFLAQAFIGQANVLLMLAAVFERTQRKYGPRGYRYVLLEAGHVAQNVCLSATEQGLGSVCLGGFSDGIVNAMVGLDPTREAVVYAVAAGWPGDDGP